MCAEPLLRVRRDLGAFTLMMSFSSTNPYEAGVTVSPHFIEEQTEAQGS